MRNLLRLVAIGALVLGMVPASLAADFSADLCADTRELQLKLDAMGDGVFDVHGVLVACPTCAPARNLVVAGTGVLEDANNMRVGITLLATDNETVPVLWEFVVDLTTREASGHFEWLTAGELFGQLFLGPGPCPERAARLPPEAFGATRR